MWNELHFAPNTNYQLLIVMTLQQAIKAVWNNNAELEKRIPPSFLVYHSNPFDRVPRATFNIKKRTVEAKTNQGAAAEKTLIEFTIIETTFQNALTDSKIIIDAFDSVSLDLISRKQKTFLTLLSSDIHLDDALWTATITFNARIIRY